MAVLLETSVGDLVIDLFVDECPKAAKNFLKLCKIKYYNNTIFHNVQKDFLVQAGDPTGTGKGGESVFGVLYGEQARYFEDEIHDSLRHSKRGLVGMASAGQDKNGSQFYITTGAPCTSLDGRRTLFGEVSEGLDVLAKINEAYCDGNGKPFQNIRVRHTIVLDDPFDDPKGLESHVPDSSPAPIVDPGDRLEEDWAPDREERDPEEQEEATRKAEAAGRAVVLEMIGDLPDADVKPPSNVLFVCKLNPVTNDEDLEIIFARFGKVTDCQVIRDAKTGDSLSYAFIGFEDDAAAEEAYFKMNNCLIDDRRIKVDFSQSVAKLWRQFKRHGARGTRDMQAEAAAHQDGPGQGRPARGGGPGMIGGLELRQGAFAGMAGPRLGAAYRGGGERERERERERGRSPEGGRERDGARGEERGRRGERERGRDDGRRRSRDREHRDRDRDRGRRDRDRERDRGSDRDRRRSRERDRHRR
ncbi:unnamed protein product [Pedinophyceae sp. YPF-701]|nr:unnamed protein product [Pedinophyceae sp. YPF-701]